MDAATYLTLEFNDPEAKTFEKFFMIDEGEDYCFFGIEKDTMRCRYIYGLDPQDGEGTAIGFNFDMLCECRAYSRAVFQSFLKTKGIEVETYDRKGTEEDANGKPAYYERVRMREYLVDIHVPLLVRCPANAFNVEHASELALADLKARADLYAFRVEDYIEHGTVNFVWKPEDLENESLPKLVADLTKAEDG